MQRTSRWRRFWSVWAAVFTLSGILGDVAAYTWGGYETTLTANIRRWTQLEPIGPYSRLGRAALVVFFTWCIVHFGWGIADPIPRSYSPIVKRRDDA